MNFFKISERYIFYLVTGIHLIPLLIHHVFFTIDGPAHVYNAKIISDLWNSENIFNTAFRINPELVPNWTGHLILICLNFLFNPLLSEKLLQILLVAGMPLSFRFAIVKLKSPSIYWSYFVFPFSYSFVFINGFYNYCLSLIFFFLALGFLASFFTQPFSFKNFIILWLLFLLTYFSHPFTFIFLMLVTALLYLITLPFTPLWPTQSTLISTRQFLFKGVLIFVISFIPLILLKSYLLHREQSEEIFRFSENELLRWLWQYRPLVLYSWDEVRYTQPLVLTLFVGVVSVLYLHVFGKRSLSLNNLRQLKLHTFFNHSAVFLLLMILSLLFYFIMPDTDRNASFISVRTCMMFFFFMLFWIAQFPVKRWLIVCLMIITVSISLWRLNHINKVVGILNEDVTSLLFLDQFIQPEKTIIPIDASGNWLYGHLMNYIAVFKPVLLLENYEASKKYFPVLWKEQSLPDYALGSLTQNTLSCLYWKTNPEEIKVPVDYVLVNGSISHSTDSCVSKAYNEILSSYEWVTNSGNFTLYRLRK